MPVRREDRGRYPSDWPEISIKIKKRARWRCECRGECGWELCGGRTHRNERRRQCGALHGQPHPSTGSKVVLTVAHLDHTPENCDPGNLRAMCQGCHLAYDRDHHTATARATRASRSVGDRRLIQPDACTWCGHTAHHQVCGDGCPCAFGGQ